MEGKRLRSRTREERRALALRLACLVMGVIAALALIALVVVAWR